MRLFNRLEHDNRLRRKEIEREIAVPVFLKTLKPIVRRSMKKYFVVGGDSETFEGKPFTLQFSHSKGKDVSVLWVDEKNTTKEFLKYCDGLLNLTDQDITIWVHNLSYDMISFFFPLQDIFLSEKFDFKLERGWQLSGVYSNVVFARLEKAGRTIWILDTFAYFKTSLEKLALIHCPDLPKKAFPKGLGEKKFGKDDKEFIEYAERDSIITEIVGEYILAQHYESGITVAVSAPHFSSKIFRKEFLKKPIPLPSKAITFSAIKSYHGGKNNCTKEMGFYPNVYSLDIVSAYPDAMRQLPSFSNKALYRQVQANDCEAITEVPDCGIYRISGNVRECDWPIIFDHNFKKVTGEIKWIWVTGYELNEALLQGEIQLTDLYGYYYAKDEDLEPSPFVDFVDHFFSLKDNAGSKAQRDFAKLCLNSLYGKFIQTTKERDAETEFTYDVDAECLKETVRTAGGLFNPFIATLITGYVRAKIHNIEHKYRAIHTATDGVFSFKKPLKESKELGGLKIECKGDLLLLRNKLYIFYVDGKDLTKEDKEKYIKSAVFNDKYIIKYALHGFHGKVYELEKMYVTGQREYTYTHVNKLRESKRRKLDVNRFEKRKGSLNLGD